MKKLNLKLIFLFLYIGCPVSVSASPSALNYRLQNPAGNNANQEPLPVIDVLKKLTALYQANFLYEERTVKDKKIIFNATLLKGKNIEKVLTELLTPIGLRWIKIDDKNYSIAPVESKKQLFRSSADQTETKPLNLDSVATASVSGKLLDRKGRGIEFTTISLLRTVDSVSIKKVLSDTSGFYLFTAIAAGEYIIKAAGIGYQTAYSAKFNVQAGATLNLPVIYASELPQTLNEVKITSSKQVIETKSDRFIFNVANSAMASGNSIQLLKSAPFVKVGADQTVTLQGKKTMILIDNKPVADAALQSVLQSLPAGNIAQVELITSPSAKYDAAYGAVINIITKKAKIEGITASVSADGSTGSYALGYINSSLTYKHKGLTLYGNGGITDGKTLFEITGNRVITHDNTTEIIDKHWNRVDHIRSKTYQLGGELELDKNQTIGLLAGGIKYHFTGDWTTTNSFRKGGSGIDSVLNTYATIEQPLSIHNYNFNYHLLSDSGKNELTVLGNFTPFRRNLYQNFPSVLLNGAGQVIKTPATYQSRNIGRIDVYVAQVDYVHTFNKAWKLETGFKYQRSNSKNSINYQVEQNGQFETVPEYSSNNEFTETINSAYGILSKDWKQDKLQIGVRAEKTEAVFIGAFNQHYFNAFPTFLYQHNINADNKVSFSFKRTINRTPYYELVPYSVFSDRYTLEQGNPALKPSYDNIFAVTTNIKKVNFTLNYITNSGLFAMLPFKQDFQTNLTTFSRQNLDRAYEYSLYVYFPLRITSWWETQNSGTAFGFNKAEGKILGKNYSLSAYHSDFKVSNVFQLSKILKLQIDAYYWTKYIGDLTRYSGYKSIDGAFLLTLFAGKGQLRVAADQLLLKRNDYTEIRDFGAYKSNDLTNLDQRRVSIGFSYKFGKTTIKSPDKKLGNEEAMKRLQ